MAECMKRVNKENAKTRKPRKKASQTYKCEQNRKKNGEESQHVQLFKIF